MKREALNQAGGKHGMAEAWPLVFAVSAWPFPEVAGSRHQENENGVKERQIRNQQAVYYRH